mmetsp:Transcript_10607/g.18611  ORF Transcript_10607/g.18611 Transcript_10607/m.18611 type:complete len:200 (-) Transcript_10607:67-666(-)
MLAGPEICSHADSFEIHLLLKHRQRPSHTHTSAQARHPGRLGSLLSGRGVLLYLLPGSESKHVAVMTCTQLSCLASRHRKRLSTILYLYLPFFLWFALCSRTPSASSYAALFSIFCLISFASPLSPFPFFLSPVISLFLVVCLAYSRTHTCTTSASWPPWQPSISPLSPSCWNTRVAFENMTQQGLVLSRRLPVRSRRS